MVVLISTMGVSERRSSASACCASATVASARLTALRAGRRVGLSMSAVSAVMSAP